MSPGEATLVGRTIGSYQVVAEIGRGGMGAVYRAEHPLIGRKVAIKVILGEVSKDADTIGRFFNEARAAASIRHRALVDVFDFGYLPEGSAYLVMDYLEGETLGARLARGRFPANLAVNIARQVASGMAVAHAKGIIHRDLKPENIFLMADEGAAVPQAKILDFGIAKLTGEEGTSVSASQRTRTGILMGTPLYMSPEQCRGAGAVDKRTDLYSLGCIIYAMLVGGPPFQFEAPGELIAAHLFTPPPPIRSLEPSVPSAVEAVVMRLLAKKPEERQQSMADLERELEQLTAATPARPEGARMPAADQVAGPARVSSVAAAAAREVDTARVKTQAAVVAERQTPTTDTLDDGAVSRTSPVLARRRLVPLLAIGGGAVVAIGAVLLLRSAPAPAPGAKPDPRAPVVATAPAAPPPIAPAVVAAAPAVPAAAPPAPEKPTPTAPAATQKAPSVATRPSAPVISASESGKERPRHAEEEVVTITAHNARPGTTVRVDGHKASLPLKFSKDGKSHTLTFEAPNFEPETVEVRASRDHNVTLKNRPFLLMP